ncbi:hypothetical protein Bpfe_017749 [Biomphalaria pfeifferi]|uniref:Uncharacterized protein n=1 Tax=Biomphalaria pfeifferi TaxID=112525 RepID=A0AAD8F698_BIOPF|nr:hypothetical protein Bpfe_017749 [Biomphalaria pfeifferi]
MKLVAVLVFIAVTSGISTALLTALLGLDCLTCLPTDFSCRFRCPELLRRQLCQHCSPSDPVCMPLCLRTLRRRREIQCLMCHENLSCLIQCGYVGVSVGK